MTLNHYQITCNKIRIKKFKFKLFNWMLQRQSAQHMYQHSFQLKLEQSEQQLSSDFYQLAQLREQIRRNKISTVQCSNILQQMIQKMTHPLIGIELIMDKFNQMDLFQTSGFKPFETIQAKASSIYVEVIMSDLKKMVDQQPIDSYSHDEVKNMIQEINWKMGMEKSIHESRVQEVGQHVDLMKFFEGVRNYQNWNEKVKKQTIQKLKHTAQMIQLNLTLKKGFIMSKIQKITKSYQQSLQRLFINKCKNISKVHKIAAFGGIVQKNSLKEAFDKIYESSIELKDSQKLRNLFEAHWTTKIVSKVHKQLLVFLKTTLKNKLFASKIQKVINSKKLSLYAKVLQKLNFKRKVRASNISLALQKLNLLNDRISKINAIKALNIPMFRFFKLLNKSVLFILSQNFKEIERQAKANTKRPSELSLKTRAKILNALPTPQDKPVDIRHAFHNWYIKGNQRKFSKQVYNIWLTGTTSKFTFFMRLKNLIDQNRNYKIKYELKLFLMVFNEKMNKYYNTCQKSMIQKWVNNTRRIKRIQKAFNTLSTVQKENDEMLKKHANNKLIKNYHQILSKQKFCFKYMNNYISNVKTIVNTWKVIPDVKRSKGQILMRNIFRKVIQKIGQTKAQSFSVFKQNKIVGRDKKVLTLRRAFNQDYIYLQKFFQMWRMKKNDLIKKDNDFQDRKGKVILLMEKYHNAQTKKNVKDIIKKFAINKNQQKLRTIKTRKVFINILQNNQKSTMINIMLVFKSCWQEGKVKKNNLVKSFVEANKKKQELTILLIRNKANEMYNLEKIKRTEELFSISEDRFKNSITIFDKTQYIYKYLCKILTNRGRNFHLAFKNIQALPNRMNWKKRDNAIKLYETLQHFYKRNKGYSFQKYKEYLMVGRFKMTKSMDIMAAKYFDVTRKYFNTYRKNINRIKDDQINKAIGVNFQHLNEVFTGNMKSLFIGEAEWKKKADHIVKLNQRIKVRIGQAFKLWRQSSKAMIYYEGVLKEKKVRYIEILMKALSKNQAAQSKKMIGMFKKNAKVTDVQITFLKRLCDSQAGKVVKAMMIWKNLPEPKNKQKISKATKFESLMARIGIRNFKKTFLIFKDGQYYGNEKKKYCIRQLVAKSNSGIKSYFQKWKSNSKLSILFGQCEGVGHLIHSSQALFETNFRLLFEGNEAQVKRGKLHGLNLILCQQKRQLLYLWREKMIGLRNFDKKKKKLLANLIDVQQKTENKNIRDFAIKKFAQIRLQALMEKKRAKEVKLLEIVDNAMKRRKQNISQTYEVFKFNLYKGNFKKKRAFENWLKDKIAQIHGYMDGWNNLAQQAVLADKRKYIGQNFEQMDNIVRANISHIISNRRELEIKKKALNNLFRTQQLQLKGYINLWHNRCKELKILSQMDNQAKKSILERINKIVSIGSEQNVKKAIIKFKTAMKVEMVQKKFINQLLKTKSGKVLQAINKWKSIPAINLGEKYKKGQKFFNKMDNFSKSYLRFTYLCFKKNFEEANMMKKQSILQLFEMTSTGIRRYYRRWQKLSKEKHTLNSVHELMKSMDIMSQCISNQYMIIFQDQRAYKVKISAINRLIEAANGTQKGYFDRWRSNVKQMKIQESMDVSKKTLALQMFTKALEGSQTTMIFDAIKKFRRNAIVTDVSKKFFNRLLQTKTGKVLSVFVKLKSIPDAKVASKKKKAIKFETSLNRFAMKIMRSAFNPFKNCNYMAIDRKKYCLTKLVRNSMGEQIKSFTRWRNVTHEAKVLMHSEFSEKCFSNMQNILFNTIAPIFTDYKQQAEKKRGLCRKLVMNSQFVQHHAFMIWKEAHREDDLRIVKKQSKRRDVLKNLINVFNNHEKKSTVSGFSQFRNVLMLDRLQTFSNQQTMHHTKAYNLYELLQKLKNSRFALLIESCRSSAIEMNFANKVAALETMFSHSTEKYSQNLMLLMRSQRQTVIIQNALNRIFSNFKVGTEKAFNIWRQNIKVLKLQQQMGNDKKKTILEIMNKFIGNSENMNIKNTIEKFRINSKQLKIQKQILMKILNCKAGQVPILFMKWKALPSQVGKKHKMRAMKFETSLFRAWSQRMKFVYQNFKNQSYDATVKKQYAIRKLIAVTQSDSNRTFNKWRTVNAEAKITSKMINMDTIFSNVESGFFKNLELFNEYKEEKNAKVNALNAIFLTQQTHMKDSLNRWVEENKLCKITKITQALSKYTEEELAKRFVKQAFNKITQRFELQTMKGYINSLWRWKMTNTETQYYEKFIKVFSQSQEVLNLSKILNKKESDTLHFAFSQIKLSSKVKFDRKCYLVQKYLSKKVKHYIDAMRTNAYRTNLSTLKDMYSQVVKTQQFTNIIAKVTRRQQNDVLHTLKLNENYLQKVQKLTNKIAAYKDKNTEEAFKNINRYGYYKLLKAAYDTRKKVEEHFYIIAMESVAESAKLRYFDQKLANVAKSSSIRNTFQILRKNSQRLVKQKLALLLLSGQISKKIHQNKVRAIQSFNRRRIKCICLNKVAQTLSQKVHAAQKVFFQIDQNDIKIINLLQKFKRGTAIKNLLDKQDKKLLANYFQKLKKKENKWMDLSIQKFATRSSVRSSLAVSLWRLKTYAEN